MLFEVRIVFEREYFGNDLDALEEDSGIDVVMIEPHVFEISGVPVEKMLGYTNLESEKGFDFFQKFMRKRGILDRL